MFILLFSQLFHNFLQIPLAGVIYFYCLKIDVNLNRICFIHFQHCRYQSLLLSYSIMHWVEQILTVCSENMRGGGGGGSKLTDIYIHCMCESAAIVFYYTLLFIIAHQALQIQDAVSAFQWATEVRLHTTFKSSNCRHSLTWEWQYRKLLGVEF